MALPFMSPSPAILTFSLYNKRMESDGYYLGLALEAAREGLAAGEVPVERCWWMRPAQSWPGPIISPSV